MRRFLLGTSILPLLALSALADDGIKWGDPVNGLRVGIESSVTSIASDQNATFTVTAQNVSAVPITIPTPETYLHKANPRSNNCHEVPLGPIIQETSHPNDPGNPRNHTTVPSTSYGKSVEDAQPQFITLEAGQSVIWKGIRLEKSNYFVGQDTSDAKTYHQHWFLLPGCEYDIRFQFANEETPVAGTTVWTGKMESGATHLQVVAPSLEGVRLEGKFTIPKQYYFTGEPIAVTFTVTNKGDMPVAFPTGGDYAWAGRPQRFSFKALDEQGKTVPDLMRESGLGGGIGSDARIGPGTSITEKILLNHWFSFSEPGKYVVTGTRILNIIQPDPQQTGYVYLPEDCRAQIPIESSFTITVYDDPGALYLYLMAMMPCGWPWEKQRPDPLTREPIECLALAKNQIAFPFIAGLLNGSQDTQVEAVRWLAAYGSEQSSPVLLKHASNLVPWARGDALQALSNWNTPGTEQLMAAALQDQNNEVRADAVRICSGKWYGSCVPILLTMGDDPYPLVKQYLGSALGACGDPRAIPVLIGLLHDSDSDPFIKIWAAEGLGKFKRMEGAPVMIDLLRNSKTDEGQGNAMLVLENLTGQKFDENQSAWINWWEKTGRAEYAK